MPLHWKIFFIFAILLILSKILMMKFLGYDIVDYIFAPGMYKKYKKAFASKNLHTMIECYSLQGIWELRNTKYYIFGFDDRLIIYPPNPEDETPIRLDYSEMRSFSVKMRSGKVDFTDHELMAKDIEKIVLHHERVGDITIRFRNYHSELAFNLYALPRANFFEFLATKIPYEEYTED